MSTKGLMIAGTQSGVGKTTITAGLCAAWRRRGQIVQPFKAGPDYIDPGYHRLAASRACRNLDSWMMSRSQVERLFRDSLADVDIAVVEGVMGLFDGLDYHSETASTAQLSKWLGLPIIVVLDANKQARSAAAVARGFQTFDPDLNIAGFVVNRVGSDSHGQGVAHAIEQATRLPVFGWLPRLEQLTMGERHLGLIPVAESAGWKQFIEQAAEACERFFDMDRLWDAAATLESASNEGLARGAASRDEDVVIAVARDEAFHFLYDENVEQLERVGARVVFFSPLHDSRLPAGTKGVILCGGFPELYAEDLAANQAMHAALRSAHQRRLPIYAECGGLMYLAEWLVDQQGRKHAGVGLIPGTATMTKRLTLGYRIARPIGDTWLGTDDEVRGHEFHYGNWSAGAQAVAAAYELVDPKGKVASRLEGACSGNLVASFVHLHFGANPHVVERFVSAARGAAAVAGDNL